MTTNDSAPNPVADSRVDAPTPNAPSWILDVKDDIAKIDQHHAREVFGSDDDGFIKGILNQVFQLANGGGQLDEHQVQFIGGALLGIKPKDTLEGMLAAQIIANHILTMKFAGMLYRQTTFQTQEAVEKLYTKLARTTPAQMEALRSKRTGGRQRVKVEHVHVHSGGQAIVGNVDAKGRGDLENGS